MKKLFLSFCFISSLSYKTLALSSAVENLPINKVTTSQTPVFRKYPDNLFMTLRSNVEHFWHYSKIQSQNPQFSDLYKYIGLGVGDFHMLNFADIELQNAQRTIGLVDIDDGGENIPLLIDLTRGFIASELSPVKIDPKILWDSYLLGLNNQISPSKYIEKIKSKTNDDFLKKQEKYLKKMTSGNQFSDNSGLIPINQTDLTTQNLFAAMKETFKAEIKSINSEYQILDFRYKTKSTGGSQGLPRFWALLASKKNNLEIIEFKQLVAPGSRFFSNQKPESERFDIIKNSFRPSKNMRGTFKIVTKDGLNFLMRTRYKKFIDFDIDEDLDSEDQDDLIEFTKYIFNLMGQWHFQSDATRSYQNYVKNNSAKIFQLIMEFEKNYLINLENENKN